MPEHDFTVYEDYVGRMMDIYQVPGIAVAVAQNGEIVYERGFGFRDREANLPVTEKTVFGIGSCTKSFTAMAILQLEEQGKLSVEDPITKYLPEFRFGKASHHVSITLHHLLTHSSGLPVLPSLHYAMLRSMREDPHVEKLPDGEPIDTYEQLMEFIGNLDIEPLGSPGCLFSYSNDSWALLGAIIERVSGKPYETYVSEHILQPLGMSQSTFDPKKLDSLETTSLYVSKTVDGKEQIVAAPGWWQAPAMSAAGFLRSNVEDMLRYLDVYRTGGTANGTRVLAKKNIDRMITPYMWRGGNSFYGYGLGVLPNYHGVSLVEHSGGIKGVSAHIIYVPEKGITGVALANLAGVPSNQILLGAVNVLLGLPVDTRRYVFTDYACPEERLPLYAGEYPSPEAGVIKVSVEEGSLIVEARGARTRARPTGVNTFAVKQKEMEEQARFLVNPRGEVWAIEFGGRVIRKARHKGN